MCNWCWSCSEGLSANPIRYRIVVNNSKGGHEFQLHAWYESIYFSFSQDLSPAWNWISVCTSHDIIIYIFDTSENKQIKKKTQKERSMHATNTMVEIKFLLNMSYTIENVTFLLFFMKLFPIFL